MTATTSYPTTISKGRDGFQAKTTIPLGFDRRELHVSTYKQSRGGLYSSAQCVQVSEDGRSHSFIMFGDFRTELERDIAARCTEKTVTAKHSRALEGIADVIEQCRKFYADKAAKREQEAREFGIAA